MKHPNKHPKSFPEKFHQKKETIKNSLLEVECFLDKTTSLSEILKIFKIIKKH